MKKTLLVVLTILVAFAAFAGGSNEKVVILNNALPKLETSSQNYNAMGWYKSYSMAELVKENFWYQPTDATKTFTGSAEPSITLVEPILWGADATAKDYKYMFGFKDRYVSFVFMDPDAKIADYDIYLGSGVGKTKNEVMYMNYSVIGNEAVLFLGWDTPVADIFDAIEQGTGLRVADPTSWKIVDVEGKETVVSKAEFADAYLEFGADLKTVNFVTAKQTIKNVQSFAPEAATAATPAKEGEVVRFVVALNAKTVYGAEAKYEMNRAGTMYPNYDTIDQPLAGCYSLKDLFAKYGVKEGTTFGVECYTDGYTREEAWDWISEKYMAFDWTREMFTLGKAQSKADDSVWQIGYLNSDDVVFAYIPEGGLKLADAISRLAIDGEVKTVALKYADGSVDRVQYETALGLTLTQDSTVVEVILK